MTHYEQVLSKMSPTFYKLTQYDLYLRSNGGYLRTYLKHEKLRQVITQEYGDYYFKCLRTYSNYYFHLGYLDFHCAECKESVDIIVLTTKDKVKYVDTSLDYFYYMGFIVNMIINNFSYETSLFTNPCLTVARDFKKTFIAMVGQDMYETIKNNSK